MRRLTRYVVALGALAGAGALLYRYGLSDEAKNGLKAAAHSVKDAYETISDHIRDLYGSEMEEDVAEHQREISRQWEDLGF